MIGVNYLKKQRIQAFTTLQHYITTLPATCLFVGSLFLWMAATRLDLHHNINIQGYTQRDFVIPLQIKDTHLFKLQEDIATEGSPSTNIFRNKDRPLLATKKHTSEGNI